MRKWLFLIALNSLFIGSIFGQSNADFENFSQDLFALLSDTAQTPPLEYIRIKTWEELIEAQDLPVLDQEEWKVKKNKAYAEEHQEFSTKLGGIVQEYRLAGLNGAKLEYLNSEYVAHPKWTNWYKCQLRFIFSGEAMQSIVEVQYELYYNGRGLVFIGTKLDDSF